MLALECHSSLAGRLEGTVTPESPSMLAPAALALELGADLSGVLDGEQTLLWPANAKVQATDDGTNFTASFSLVGLPGTDVDPLFDVLPQRTVTLDRDAQIRTGLINGTYRESIEGLPRPVIDAGPVVISGSFQLRRVAQARGLQIAASPTFVPAAPSLISPDGFCHGEPGCPDAGSPRG